MLAQLYGKPGHRNAAAAARRLAAETTGVPHEVATGDALDAAGLAPLLARHRPRIVLADAPYGRQTAWAGGPDPDGPWPEAELVAVLAAVLAAVLEPDAVIAVVARARRVPVPVGRPVLERVRAGHRAAVLVRAGDHH